MTIVDFTPVSGLIGGLLIGLASAGLALATGKIAGISGIFGRTLLPSPGDWAWRSFFLIGLIAGAAVAIQRVGSAAAFEITDSPFLLIGGGLLVGFGTQLGSGCTSGHGVCGLGRLSRRSFVAVPAFIGSGMTTVVVMRWLGGF